MKATYINTSINDSTSYLARGTVLHSWLCSALLLLCPALAVVWFGSTSVVIQKHILDSLD